MRLTLYRDIFSDKTTLGKLEIDGKFQCYTLEDKDRKLEKYPDAKVYGETCIPRGTYPVVINFSPKYQKEMPHIQDVPGFKGIRIHPGNYHEDTEGCILPGVRRLDNMVQRSVSAFETLYGRLTEAEENDEKIIIEIV